MTQRLDHVKDTTGYWLHSTWTWPSPQSNLLKEDLMDQGHPPNIYEGQRPSARGVASPLSGHDLLFTRTLDCPRSPWSPMLFVLYSFVHHYSSQQVASFMYMNNHAQLSGVRDPTQLALHVALRAQSLRHKG